VRNALAAVLAALTLASCGERADQRAPSTIVIYVHEHAREMRFAEMLAEFTAESGIAVTPRYGNSGELTDAVIGKTDSPRADVLLTSNAADIWRAGYEGALRPLPEVLLRRIPEVLRDPDGAWVASIVRTPTLVAAEGVALDGIGSYADLASPSMAGRLCIASAQRPANRALVAMLIESESVRPAERIVRGWVRNLARPPYASDGDLLAAVYAGDCEIGLVASGAGIGNLLQASLPGPYLDIDGVGVARHAGNPDGAQRFIEWIVARQSLGLSGSYFTTHVVVAGYRDEEARLLAERAGYR
jgi:iron(III) transport system substrate-binding protein